MRVKWSGPNFTPIDAKVGVRGPETKNTNISAYKRPAEVYSLGDFYQIFTVYGQLHVRSCVTIWWFRSRNFGVIEIYVSGVRANYPTF